MTSIMPGQSGLHRSGIKYCFEYCMSDKLNTKIQSPN